MAWLSSTILLLMLGIGTLFVAWQGHTSGELVVVRFFRPYRPNRENNPTQEYKLLKPLPWH